MDLHRRAYPTLYLSPFGACTCRMLRCHIWFSVLVFIFLVLSGCLQAPKIHLKTKIATTNNSNHCCKNACSQGESNPQLVLRRRLLYPFNYGNKSRIFGLFQPFWFTVTIFMNSFTFVTNFYSLFRLLQTSLLESNSDLLPFAFFSL